MPIFTRRFRIDIYSLTNGLTKLRSCYNRIAGLASKHLQRLLNIVINSSTLKGQNTLIIMTDAG